MNVYTATYPSHWLGGKAVVVAENIDQAVALLRIEANRSGASFTTQNISAKNLTLLDTSTPAAHILFTGDY